ncbi:HAD-IA family hydrolase [Nocardioides panacisoli]|uniref:HAD family phosphatase n=1 Tax=Nocardioides panacisoli TaxID=627624 RepID=A0ABP7IUZ7_9ACTN
MTYRACLVDVFDTVLSVDFEQHNAGLARHAGVDPERFAAVLVADWLHLVMDGRVSTEDALAGALHEVGSPIEQDALAALVRADEQLLHDLHVLHDDAVPFLESLRAAGVRTAFVSNCSSNTRPLLIALGLADLVDELVLSCEVGAAKPEPAIYRTALDALGVQASETVFVDDQRSYCEGAASVGIDAVLIDRFTSSGDIAALGELLERF